MEVFEAVESSRAWLVAYLRADRSFAAKELPISAARPVFAASDARFSSQLFLTW